MPPENPPRSGKPGLPAKARTTKPVSKQPSKAIEEWRKGNLPFKWQSRDDETEFLPAALEVLEQPPSPAARAISWTIIGFFALALLWACIGTVDIIASAPGKVVPTGRTKLIQPLEAGVVRAIHVQDGQEVKAGDVLIEIDATITEAERDRLQKDYVDQELTVARLQAALDLSGDALADFKPPPEASEAQIATQRSLLLSQVQDIKAKLDSLSQEVAERKGTQQAVSATIDKLNESLPYLDKRAQARDYLAQQGYGSKLEALTSQQDLVEHQQEVQVQKGKLAEANGALASLEQQRHETIAKYRQDTLKDLTEAQQKAASLHEQLLQATQKFRLQTLTAPVDGTVQQLAIHTEGGVVTPAQALMMIVPADSQLEIEAMVANQDIGFVHAGQEAAIKVETFNFTRYGLLAGRVTSVSQDAVQRETTPAASAGEQQSGGSDDEPKRQDLTYVARITLDSDTIVIDGRRTRLSPGMAVTAEIKTGSRHIIGFLLSPIRKYASQAMTER